MHADRTSPVWALLVALLWAGVGVLSLVPAMFTPMLFDAPGSTENTPTVALALSFVSLPLTCGGSAVGLFVLWVLGRDGGFRRWPAIALALLPLLSFAAVVAAWLWIDVASGGRLDGG